jgi:hypothetical protein
MQKILIEKLRENPKNPRSINEENFARLKRDMSDDPRYVEKRPLLVYEEPTSKNLIVYAGNMRLKAAKDLGWKEVPIDIDKDVTEGGVLNEDLMLKRAMRDNEEYGYTDTDKLKKFYPADALEKLEKLDLPELNMKLEDLKIQDIQTDFQRNDVQSNADAFQGSGSEAGEVSSVIQNIEQKESARNEKNNQYFYVDFYTDKTTYDDLRSVLAEQLNGNRINSEFFKELIMKK